MPGVSRRRFDVCRPRHSRAGGYFLLRQGLAERLQGTVPLCGQGAGPARLVAAGDAAEVLTHRRVGHFTIIAAVAPFLRFLLPAPQRTAPQPNQCSKSRQPMFRRNMLRRTPAPLRGQANRSKLMPWRSWRDLRRQVAQRSIGKPKLQRQKFALRAAGKAKQKDAGGYAANDTYTAET